MEQLLLGEDGASDPPNLEQLRLQEMAVADETAIETETPLQRLERLAGGSLGISEEEFAAVPMALRETVQNLANERKSALKLRSEWETQVQVMRTQVGLPTADDLRDVRCL